MTALHNIFVYDEYEYSCMMWCRNRDLFFRSFSNNKGHSSGKIKKIIIKYISKMISSFYIPSNKVWEFKLVHYFHICSYCCWVCTDTSFFFLNYFIDYSDYKHIFKYLLVVPIDCFVECPNFLLILKLVCLFINLL